jgi:hypothetical protein
MSKKLNSGTLRNKITPQDFTRRINSIPKNFDFHAVFMFLFSHRCQPFCIAGKSLCNFGTKEPQDVVGRNLLTPRALLISDLPKTGTPFPPKQAHPVFENRTGFQR